MMKYASSLLSWQVHGKVRCKWFLGNVLIVCRFRKKKKKQQHQTSNAHVFWKRWRSLAWGFVTGSRPVPSLHHPKADGHTRPFTCRKLSPFDRNRTKWGFFYHISKKFHFSAFLGQFKFFEEDRFRQFPVVFDTCQRDSLFWLNAS